MSYTKQGFKDGQLLKASHLETMENGIISKQDKLESGVNIKTINGISLLGSGNISISGGSSDDDIIIYSDIVDNWVQQNMANDGSIILPGAANYGQSNIMYSSLFTETLWLIPKGNIMWNVVLYDNNSNFVSRGSWSSISSGVQEIAYNQPFNIIVCTQGQSTLSKEEMLSLFTLQNKKPAEEEPTNDNSDIIKQLKFLNFIQSCEMGEKMVHFSIDDSCSCINDLIVNQNLYSSPFENKFFGGLKEIHDATGACFSVYTFNVSSSLSGYDISNVPTKFQSYFSENKSWLRFGFHSEADDTHYGYASVTADQAKVSYDRFVEAIYKLTGDYGCIDRMPRIGFFNCSLENALVFKNANYGVYGFLSADDDRVNNYYLNEEQRYTARQKGKYYDLENELIFINTLNRTYSKGILELQNNPLYHKFAEFFWHEGENSGKPHSWVTTAAQYCNEQGYIHGFPMDVFKPVK